MTGNNVVAMSERTRRVVALLLVFLAVVHVLVPGLAIDGVFLGLLALAGLVLFFDIQSVEALGVKAKARELREAADVVKGTELPEQHALPRADEAQITADATPGGTGASAEAEHREAFDLMPPVERVARILWAAEQIRVELVILAGTSGFLSGRGSWSHYRPHHLAPQLAAKGVIPEEFVAPIRSVTDIRNAVAHGERVPGPVLESIDELALTLLSRLREVPRTFHRVAQGEVELFLDRSLTTRHPALGVMIEERDKDGRVLGRHVYPTYVSYTRGRFVTWAWDMTRVTDDEAWYVDPSDHRPKVAFSSAAAFAGREFPDQWGIEYRAGSILDE